MKYLKKSTVPELQDNNSVIAAKPVAMSWKWLPVLSLTSAMGIFLVALAYEAGRISAPGGDLLFWFGLLAIFLPIAWRLFLPGLSQRERIALLIVLAILIYLVKFLRYPLYFADYDEFATWLTAQDIMTTGHLFHQNPLLPISPFYPGLEIATSAISSMTGLPLFASGILLIGVARLVLVLSLYFCFENFTGSPRSAGIATVLYMANPAFIFFDGVFSYESFALPLAIFVLFVMSLRYQASASRASRPRGLMLVIGLGLGAVVITHHVSSYALVAFLLLWTVIWTAVYFYQHHAQKEQIGPSPGGIALLGLVLSIVWLVYTGGRAELYLGQYIVNAVHQLGQILTNERASRPLFQSTTGFEFPLWERVIAFTSVALILLALPFGLFQIWRHYRASAVALSLAFGALAYPVGQALRLIPSGAELGVRTTEFTFLGIGFVLAMGVTRFWLSRTPDWRRTVIVQSAVAIIFFGQMVLSTGQPGAPLPGPYQVSADARSIDPEDIYAAEWAASYLGPQHRIATDRVNSLLMAAYGHEWVVLTVNSQRAVTGVFISPQIGPAVTAILRQDRIQYLVVDRRLSTGLPYSGSYYDLPATQPITPAALAKFDGVKNVSRIYDSGDIQIYDVEAITSEASAASPPAPSPLCTPTSSAAAAGYYPHLAKLYWSLSPGT